MQQLPRLVVNARSLVIVQPYHTLCAIKLASALQTISSPHQTSQHAWQVSIDFNNKYNINKLSNNNSVLYLSEWLFNAK